MSDNKIISFPKRGVQKNYYFCSFLRTTQCPDTHTHHGSLILLMISPHIRLKNN